MGEIRVFVTDAKGNVPDLGTVSALLFVDPVGGKRDTVKTTVQQPKKEPAHAAKHEEEDHGGAIPEDAEVKEAGAWHVGVQFVPPHDEHEEHAEEKDHGEEEEHGDAHPANGEGDHDGAHEEEAPSVAYFSAPYALDGYVCQMKDAPPQPMPGKCPKCGMKMEAAECEFDVAVTLKINGENVTAKGFHHPRIDAPASYAEGLAHIEKLIAEMNDLSMKGQLAKVHPVADRIRRIARGLGTVKDTPKDAAVAAASKRLISLFGEMDEAADSGKADQVKTMLKAYREQLDKLKAASHAGH